MIQKFFIEECIPQEVVTDPAGELKGDQWKRICTKFLTKARLIESKSQWQDRAERWIGHLKEMVQKILNKTGAPNQFWSYCIVHASAIFNHTALEYTNWKTQYELLHGSTPDISIF